MAKQTDPLINQKLGEYKIKKMVGKGGMSRVYQAEDENLGRDVAIKVITLDPDRAKELMKRFEREGRTIGQLDKHPNIIRVHRYGSEGDIRYLAMEFIDGDTLTQRLANYKKQGELMPYVEVINILRQVADALDYAHKHGVIHRDIKPSNIMLEHGRNRAVLMDFGLVMQANTDTTLGTAFGTPRYISPEQAISSQQAVPQSDIYSLAVIIYEMLCGQAPFDDDSAMSLALSHITNPPPNPQDIRDDLPPAAAKVLLKALEKSPEDRYQTAMEMIDELARALELESDHPSTAAVAPGVAQPVPAPEAKTAPEKKTSRAKKTVEPSPSVVEEKHKTDPGKPEPQKPTPVLMEAPPVQNKKEKAPMSSTKAPLGKDVDNDKDNNQRLIVFGFIGLIVLLFVIIGATSMLSNGGDDDENKGGGTTTQGDILLTYTNDYLTVINQSGESLNITGLEFVLPDGGKRFITRDVGASKLEIFEDGRCVHVKLRNTDFEPPSRCTEELTIPLEYFNQTDSDNLYWVWLSGMGNDQFNAVLDGNILAKCKTGNNSCAFNLN